jgi:membrane protease YdiL (CAAX protease family)
MNTACASANFIRLTVAACAITAACAPLPHARMSPAQPPSPRERESARIYHEASCAAETGLWFPGLGQFCQHRVAEGVTLATLGAAELATGAGTLISTEDWSHPGVTVPLIAFQNTWIGGYGDALFVEQRSRRLLYVPQDTLPELAVAPFNPNVLSRLEVWLGLVGFLGAGLTLSAAVDGGFTTDHLGEDANLFGRRFEPGVGYPLAGATGLVLFTHVAIGEEILFRGMIQSELARRNGQTAGWIGSSLVFGVVHAPNALGLPHDQQARYLAIGVPFLTLAGGYLGLVYRGNDYSLAPPVAVHFWYDLLISAVGFALDPGDSPLSARVAVPF